MPAKRKLLFLVPVCLAVLLGYFFLTPRGSISRALLLFNPIYAFTYSAEITTSPDGETVYLLNDPVREPATQARLDRWTVRRAGLLYFAEYGYA